MATRGLRTIRGSQITSTELRDHHFSVDHKINEDKIAINWANHKEMLQATKIDVTVQQNDVQVNGVNTIDITANMSDRVVSTGLDSEGVVTSEKVILRKSGTQDSPIADTDGDPIYGKIRYESGDNTWHLDFFSIVDGTETPCNITDTIDYLFVIRTNLANIPVDALIRGGGVFVEGAMDAKAYFNILQLVKDVYGASGTADNDGNPNLTDEGYGASLYERIQNYISAIASTQASKGAKLVGVTVNANYTGTTVQDVLDDLAARIVDIEGELIDARTRSANTVNGVFVATTFPDLQSRFGNIEQTVDTEIKELKDRVSVVEANDEEELVVEADGTDTQTSFTLPNPAIAQSVKVFVNGLAQAPTINYDRVVDGNGNVTEITLPSPLTIGPDGVPDVLYVSYTKASIS